MVFHMTEAARLKATVYVGGLDHAVNERILTDAFIPFGEIVEVSLPKPEAPSSTELHRGFGYVEFEIPADAKEAIDNMNESELFGRVIKVAAAKPQKESNEGLGSKSAVWDQVSQAGLCGKIISLSCVIPCSILPVLFYDLQYSNTSLTGALMGAPFSRLSISEASRCGLTTDNFSRRVGWLNMQSMKKIDLRRRKPKVPGRKIQCKDLKDLMLLGRNPPKLKSHRLRTIPSYRALQLREFGRIL